jgi:hypothetical protein
MSLINDALKQASQSRPQNPPAAPPPLLPIESAAPGGGRWLAPVLIILLLAAAGIFIGLSRSKYAPPVASTPPIVATQQVALAAAVVPPVVTNAPPGTNIVAVVPARPPEPKLQGILYDARRPCAIVSGQTVFVGDQVAEFRVTAISHDNVTLQSGTETNVLSLNRQ